MIRGATSQPTSAQISSAIGYTPLNKAGDTLTGPLLAADGTSSAPAYSFSSSPSTGIFNNAGKLTLAAATNYAEQRNGVNPQSYRVYNTYTDASNYECALFDWATTANQLTISTAAAGTGSNRSLGMVLGNNKVLVGPYSVTIKADVHSLTMNGATFGPEAAGVVDLGAASQGWKRLYVDYTNTATIGTVTINKAAGRVNMAAGLGLVVITNSFCTAASHVFLSAGPSGNAVGVSFEITPGAGTFTINAVPAVINNTAIDFFIVNAD